MSVVTEAEALHKWCPFAQVAVSASDDVVANTLSGKAVTCAGSNCMAWRWAEPQMAKSNDPMGKDLSFLAPGRALNAPITAEAYEKAGYRKGDGKDDYKLLPRRGFCGMAARPE